MPILLRRLPFGETPIHHQGNSYKVRKHQIVIWMSVVGPKLVSWNDGIERFPVILDPGHSHNFLIDEGQLRRFAKIDRTALSYLGTGRIDNEPVKRYAASLWLHRNYPGCRDDLGKPYRLNLEGGILVNPAKTPPDPRLPVLGLKCLDDNELRLIINGKDRVVQLQTCRWWHRP